ncbi:hypothetical protein [Nocardia cyriacigeorgica]|uniref:hypothetical protein n=1 Tax=Nocardia cyriacigeorgica TaxID=135487 RepID=UPI00201293A6|nr:hypothetical protein [Nocardia cyriacigeorgica]
MVRTRADQRRVAEAGAAGGYRVDVVLQGRRNHDSLLWRQLLGLGGIRAQSGDQVAVPVELDGLEPLLFRRQADAVFLVAEPFIEADGLVQEGAAVSEVFGAVVVRGVTVARRGQVDDEQVRIVDRGAVVDQQHHMVVGLDAGAVGSGVFPLVDQDRDSTGPRLERLDHLVQRPALLEPRIEYPAYIVAAISAEPGRRHPATIGVVRTQHSHSGNGIVDTAVGTAPMDLYDQVEQSRERQISRRRGNDIVG